MGNISHSGHNHTHTITHNRAFAIGITLNILFVIIEVIYGFKANSTALLADAGHNVGDILSLIFAWAAAYMATLKPKGKYTYGLRKTTILVSLLNSLILFGASAAIAREAISKFSTPEPAQGLDIMVVAGIGILINGITALLFLKGQKNDLNIRGAFLHMAADAAVSLGVVISGLLIYTTNLNWIDPVTSLIIVVIIIISTWRLFTDSLNLALDAVPKNIDITEVRQFLLSQKGVANIHDLHIWAISTTQISITVHLVMPDGHNDLFITQLKEELLKNYGIDHSTFQIEQEDLSIK